MRGIAPNGRMCTRDTRAPASGRLWWLLAALVAASLVGPPPVSAQQAVYLVRHAERVDDSTDAVLSEAGTARAGRLARMLRDAGVTAIYATQFRRTQQTAAPLAREMRIEVDRVPSDETDDLVDRLRARHADKVVLVVGHSNTVPQVLAAYGHAEPIQIAPDEYDSLFVVVPRTGGPPTVLRLRF